MVIRQLSDYKEKRSESDAVHYDYVGKDSVLLSYEGRDYAGNKRAIAIQLRVDFQLSYAQIGELLDCSDSYIGQIMPNHLKGRIKKYPELDDPDTFKEPDEVIATRLGVSVGYVCVKRLKLELGKREQPINVSRRRQVFCESMYAGFTAGPEFKEFLEQGIRNSGLSRKRMLRLLEFYIEGVKDDLNRRVYRFEATKLLREKLPKDIEQLLKEGVLKNGIEDEN